LAGEQIEESAAPQGAPDNWRRAYDWLGHVGGLILAVMAGAVFLQVVLRFLGKTGIDGLEEVPRYLFVWLIMIGGASAMQRGQHTVLDYFVNLCGPRTRALILVLTTAASLGLFLYLIKLSVTLVPNAQLQTSAGLGLPLGYVYAAVPVGAVLIALPMLRELVAALRRVWQKPS
jgi:TRAP-type C4-dicarboxylate transport system permease small subunit